MATHQVHLSLRRATRKPRTLRSLAVHGGLVCMSAGSAVVGVSCATLAVAGREWGVALILGLAGAGAGAIAAAALAGRMGASLTALAQAAWSLAEGDFRVNLPNGPGGEVARLAGAFIQMASTLAGDRRGLQERCFSLEERLRRATAESKQRGRELERLLHLVSHDLRAPTLGIQGFATLLHRNLGRKLDEQSREHLSRIRASAEAMDVLLRELLDSRASEAEGSGPAEGILSAGPESVERGRD